MPSSMQTFSLNFPQKYSACIPFLPT
jgi:hypothetical protein